MGSAAGVVAAKESLSKFMEIADKEVENHITKELALEDEHVPRIIGKAGSTLARIRQECRVTASVDNAARKCALTGSPEAVAKAEEMIQQILADRDERPAAAESASAPAPKVVKAVKPVAPKVFSGSHG